MSIRTCVASVDLCRRRINRQPDLALNVFHDLKSEWPYFTPRVQDVADRMVSIALGLVNPPPPRNQ